MLDVDSGRFLDANMAAEKLFGLPCESLLEMGPFDFSPRWQPGGLSSELGGARIAEAVRGGVTKFEWWHRNAQGERFPCDVQLVQMPWQDRVVVRGSIVETSDKKLLQLSDIGRREIYERIACGDSISETLGHMVLAIERLLPGMLCTVLLLDRASNRLRHASAPSLPDFYNAAVDGIAIGPTVGSCGAAAFHRRRVIVSDVAEHPNWVAFRELTERAQIRACWSEPILSIAGEVLGTFAMYYGEPAEPAPFELRAIQLVAGIAASAIELVNAQQALQEMNTALNHRIAEATQTLVEANSELTRAELDARLSATAFQTYDSIVITDKSGHVLRVNDSFTKLTGYTAEEVIGKNLRILRSGRHDENFYHEMWRAISREGFWSGEIWNLRKDGHAFLQLLTIAAVRDASGEITHYVGDAKDLTLQKQSEIQRAELLAARAVQQDLLPSSFPALPGFDIAAAFYPADEVSGDFYDIFTLADNSVGIVVADVSLEKAQKVADEITSTGANAAAVRLDVTDPQSCRDAIAFTVATFGKLTTLANVAAAATPLGDAEKLALDDWNMAFQVNVTGQFLMCKFAVSAMRKAGGGAIVSIASSHGHIGMPGRPAYCASKAAVLQLTKCLAIDFAKDNIRANTISPGTIDTERAALQRFKSREEANRAKGPAYLVGRTGRVEEIAAGAVYLCSDESSFMTGTDLLLDGGYLAFKGTTDKPV